MPQHGGSPCGTTRVLPTGAGCDDRHLSGRRGLGCGNAAEWPGHQHLAGDFWWRHRFRQHVQRHAPPARMGSHSIATTTMLWWCVQKPKCMPLVRRVHFHFLFPDDVFTAPKDTSEDALGRSFFFRLPPPTDDEVRKRKDCSFECAHADAIPHVHT
jgi:hypothetical protein